jgi:hypothetical protein
MPRKKHIQSKAHTFTLKKEQMLKEMFEYSVKLLILKRSGLLSMLD